MACLSLAVLSLSGCRSNSDEDEKRDLFLLAALVLAYIGPGTNATFLSRANTGLAAWQIGLAQGVTGFTRNLDNESGHNPPNWITVTDSTCQARGVPDTLSANCALAGGVIGICQVRFFTAGEVGRIVDSTMLQLASFQNGSTSEAEKQSVFTHEIGHCLGLQHSGSTADIMFASTAGADTPSAGELSSVASAYSPTVQSPTSMPAKFSQTSGTPVRFWTFPVFTISHNIGNAFADDSSEELPPPGIPLIYPVETRTHYFHSDGRIETVHSD